MSSATTVQSWVIEHTFTAQDEDRTEGNRHYKLKEKFDVSKDASEKLLKIYDCYDTGKYKGYDGQVEAGKLDEFKEFLEKDGQRSHDNATGTDFSLRFPGVDLDTVIDSVSLLHSVSASS